MLAFSAVYRTKKIAFFKPLPRGDQAKFFSDQTASVRLVLGDNRSGKSACGAVESIAHSLGYRPWLPEGHPDRIVRLPNGDSIPVPNVGRIIAQDYSQSINQTVWPKIQEWAPAGWYKIKRNNQGIPTTIVWKNGSIIHLMSDEQKDDVFEGTNGHWFWADEPIGYRKYIALRRGLVDFGGHCWMTLTPLSQPWIADTIEARANDPDREVKVYEFSIYDNEVSNGGYLTLEAINSFIADLRDDEKAARIGRQWLHLTGRVYPQWKPERPYWIEPFDIPDTWPRVCIIDPHPRKPVAVAWMAINPDNQKYMYRDLFDPSLRTIDDVAAKIKELQGDEPIALTLIDSSSQENERTSGQSVRQRFAEKGILALPAPKRNAQAGYDAIHRALKIRNDWQQPGLIVFNTCRHIKRNFLRFVWEHWRSSRDRDVKGERQTVLKNEDDFIDCIRYPFQYNVTYEMLKREMKNVPDPREHEIDEVFAQGMNLMTGERHESEHEMDLWE